MYKDKNVSLIFIIFTCLALYLVNLQVIPIDIMEARNFITAREMLQDGNWFHTTLNGFPRYEKPPLPTWITAFFGSVFGLHSWALRLPAALMTLTSFYFLYKITFALHLKAEIAKLSILVASTSFYILFSGKNGQWDIYTHGFAIIGLWYVLKLFKKDNGSLKYAILAGVFFGFSILSKGPVAIYALTLPFIATYSIVYWKEISRKSWWFLGLTSVISLIIGISWYVGVYLSNPEKVMHAMVKESGNWTSYNVRPFYYYWSFFTQSGIWTLAALLTILTPLFKKTKWRYSKHKFSYLWTMISLLLLSLIPEKKSRYLLPVLFPLAIATAVYLYYWLLHPNRKDTWSKINLGVIRWTPIVLSILVFSVTNYLVITEKWEWHILQPIALGAVCFSLFIVLMYYRKKLQSSLYAYSVLCIAIVWFGVPYAFSNYTNDAYQPISAIHSYEKELKLITYAMSDPTPEFVWDYGAKIAVWPTDRKESLKENLGILVNKEDLDVFHNTFKDKCLEHITRIDMNNAAVGSKNHRERLYIDYYLVKNCSD